MNPTLAEFLEVVRKVIGDAFPDATGATIVVDRGDRNEPAILPVPIRRPANPSPPLPV